MNRDELEKILATQRARRWMTSSRAPQKPRRFFLPILFAAFVTGILTVVWFVNSANVNTISAPSYVATSGPVATANTQQPTFVIKQVCTTVPEGHLHVRFAPSEDSDVRGYLAEGEIVQVSFMKGTIESKVFHENMWWHLLSPIEGWANASFLCETNQFMQEKSEK